MFVSCISKNCFFFRKHFPEMYFHEFVLAQGKTLWFFMQWYVLEKISLCWKGILIDVFVLLGEKLSFCIVFSFTGLFGRRQKEANINLELSPSPRMQISFCSFDFHEQ